MEMIDLNTKQDTTYTTPAIYHADGAQEGENIKLPGPPRWLRGQPDPFSLGTRR